jgi:hypothetical protein
LNIDGKSKDSLNARLDIKNLGIREDLHPIDVDDRFYMPPAQYSMSQDEKLFCQVLKDVSVRIYCIGLVGLHHLFYKGAAGPLGLPPPLYAASPVAATPGSASLEPAH